MLNSSEHEFFSANTSENANNIFVFLVEKFSCSAIFNKKEFEIVSNWRFIRRRNFMLSWVVRDKSFITLWPGQNSKHPTAIGCMPRRPNKIWKKKQKQKTKKPWSTALVRSVVKITHGDVVRRYKSSHAVKYKKKISFFFSARIEAPTLN